MSSSQPPTSEQYDLFISYAHADDKDGWVTAFVEAIREEHARFTPQPLQVFFDTEAIRSMDDWERRILEGLRQSRVMVAVLSPRYFGSDYCRKEWEVFVDHELALALPGEGIAPIYTVTVPDLEAKKADAALDRWMIDMRRRQYVNLQPWRPKGIEALREEEVCRLIQGLDEQIAERMDKTAKAANSRSTVPSHNERFVGRKEELRKLHETLALGRVGAITAVHGIGGIGKSALAFEYAHAFAWHYPGGRYLVEAEAATDLRIPMMRLAPQLGLKLTDAEQNDVALGYARLRAALEAGERSLVIVDNLDDASLLGPQVRGHLLPVSDRVHVLVTTRLGEDRLDGMQCLPLDALPDDDALELLGKYSQYANYRNHIEEGISYACLVDLPPAKCAVPRMQPCRGSSPSSRRKKSQADATRFAELPQDLQSTGFGVFARHRRSHRILHFRPTTRTTCGRRISGRYKSQHRRRFRQLRVGSVRGRR